MIMLGRGIQNSCLCIYHFLRHLGAKSLLIFCSDAPLVCNLLCAGLECQGASLIEGLAMAF